MLYVLFAMYVVLTMVAAICRGVRMDRYVDRKRLYLKVSRKEDIMKLYR